jgi:predicted dehydrogenase
MSVQRELRAGVVGVGSMGRHHARVYAEMDGVDLVGVTDVDTEQAMRVAAEYDTEAVSRASLLSVADVVSVTVPTQYHDTVAAEAIDAGVSPLVEKPFVTDPSDGWELVDRAREAGVTLAVGHVERYNPAMAALGDIAADLDINGVEARRLGPPLGENRDVSESVALDLMIHDIDVVRWLAAVAGNDPDDARVVGAAGDGTGEYTTALLAVDGVTCSLTASRCTQHKVRELFVTAEDCGVSLDYTDRSLKIHRQSLPSYATTDGGLQYRNESVTERPTVDSGEPLARELSAFVESVRNGTEPLVTGADGVRAVELAREVARAAHDIPLEVT